MFSIPNTKSLGPNRFSSGFFKVTWHITEGLVCDVIQNFFLAGHMPHFVGEIKPVLIPKVLNPVQEKDFRPISYGKVIYKCVAKLLCTRLKSVLPHLIHQNQGAFVKEESSYLIYSCVKT